MRAAAVLSFTIALALTAVAVRADKVTLVEGEFVKPFGVMYDPSGRLIVVEFASRISAIVGGKSVVLAGDGKPGNSGDGGQATAAKVNAPHALAIASDGVIYVADTFNHTIRRLDPKTGVITTFAGTTKGFAGDGGPADKAQFNETYCIALTPAGDRMIVTDLSNRRIRAIDMKTNVVTTIAGNGARGVPADGAEALKAPLVDPRAAVMDSKGNLYILERSGHALRVVDPAGKIRTLVPGPTDAKGPKTLAGPKHLCVDKNDDVYVADTDNHRVVKWVAAEGKLVPVAGTGKQGDAGVGGPPDQVQLNQPHGVYLDAAGALYISDSWNNRVLKIEK
jgi:DNA-binding beta-propeller fold protein YncE